MPIPEPTFPVAFFSPTRLGDRRQHDLGPKFGEPNRRREDRGFWVPGTRPAARVMTWRALCLGVDSVP